MAETLDEDALRALEDRLERATAAAERLLGEAVGGGDGASGAGSGAGAGADGSEAPRGWQRVDGGSGAGSGAGPRLGGWIGGEELELLGSLLTGLRDRVPTELQQRIVAALRELLVAIRALVDWALERTERRAAQPVEVQDIPIV